jgi:hypothetical protein
LKLRKKMSDVGLDCLLRQEQALTDLAVHESVGDQLEDLAFTSRGLLFELARCRSRERYDRTGPGAAAPGRGGLEAAAVVPVSAQDLFALCGVHASRIGLVGRPL